MIVGSMAELYCKSQSIHLAALSPSVRIGSPDETTPPPRRHEDDSSNLFQFVEERNGGTQPGMNPLLGTSDKVLAFLVKLIASVQLPVKRVIRNVTPLG